MSRLTGALLLVQTMIAAFFALLGDWPWFAVSCVGLFLQAIFAMDEQR